MNYFKDFISQYPALVDFLAALLGIVVTIWIARQEAANRAIRERYENLIFPLFNVLEPVLFLDEPTPDIHVEMMRIFITNKRWADGKLLECFYYFEKNPTPKTFRKLCVLVDARYDSCCRRLGIRPRTFRYRQAKKQFRGIGWQILFWARIIIRYLVIFSITTMAYFFITLTYEPLYYLGVSPVFYLGITLFVFFLAYKSIFHFL